MIIRARARVRSLDTRGACIQHMKHRINLIAVETCHEGFFQLKRYRLRHSLYEGGMSHELIRERVERLRAAAVLLYDPVRDQVVLIEQFRIGAMAADGGQQAGAWLLEIAGGMLDSTQQPESIARKEAMEEAGCEVEGLLRIGDVWISPGTASERIVLYCGRVDAGSAAGVHGLDEEGEDIKVVVLGFEQAMSELFTGRLLSSTAVMAMQWLALNKEHVRAQWANGSLPP